MTNQWNVCYEFGLREGWSSYYMFENQSNQSGSQGWEVRLMLLWNEIEVIQKSFLHRQLGVKSSTSYIR